MIYFIIIYDQLNCQVQGHTTPSNSKLLKKNKTTV